MYKLNVESNKEKCSKKLEKSTQILMQEIKYLENRDYELGEIEAMLQVNFGEKGRIAQLWSGDSTATNMLMTVLRFYQKDGEHDPR